MNWFLLSYVTSPYEPYHRNICISIHKSHTYIRDKRSVIDGGKVTESTKWQKQEQEGRREESSERGQWVGY